MQCMNHFALTHTTPNWSSSSSLSSTTSVKLKIKTSCCKLAIVSSDGESRESITSTSNQFVKHCVKLRQSSSYRHSHGQLVVIGLTPIREIFSFQERFSNRRTVECLIVLDDYNIPDELCSNAARVVRVTSAVIKKISGVKSIDSVQVIAVMRIPSTFQVTSHNQDWLARFPFPHRILVLDGIQDPGNLGTLLRSAVAFGWGGVFLLPGCCDPFNDKLLRACRGACFQIPIVSGNWTQLHNLRETFQMKMLAGHPAATTNEDPYPVVTLSKALADSIANLPLCLVLGSEGVGLSQFSRDVCELVNIPMAGEFESLNVSVAGGILMYMLQPQNHQSI